MATNYRKNFGRFRKQLLKSPMKAVTEQSPKQHNTDKSFLSPTFTLSKASHKLSDFKANKKLTQLAFKTIATESSPIKLANFFDHENPSAI